MLLSRTLGVHQRFTSLQIRLIHPLSALFSPEMTATSLMEIAISHVEMAIPHVEIATSHVEIATSHVEKAIPHVEIATSHVEMAIPHVEIATSHVEIATSHVEIATSLQENGILHARNAVHEGKGRPHGHPNLKASSLKSADLRPPIRPFGPEAR